MSNALCIGEPAKHERSCVLNVPAFGVKRVPHIVSGEVSGLTIGQDKNVNHVFRLILKRDLGEYFEFDEAILDVGDSDLEERSGQDVVLLTKQFMSDLCLSQAPLLLIPAKPLENCLVACRSRLLLGMPSPKKLHMNLRRPPAISSSILLSGVIRANRFARFARIG